MILRMLLLGLFLQANAMNAPISGMGVPSAGQAQQQLYLPSVVTQRLIPQFMQAYGALSPGFEQEKMTLFALFTEALNLLANQNKRQIQEIAELKKTLLQERKQHLQSQQNALGQLQALQTYIITLIQENECLSKKNERLSEQFVDLNNLVHEQSSPEHTQGSPECAPAHEALSEQSAKEFTLGFLNL